MNIDKDTKMYFSISENPGNFGAWLYNKAFEHLSINAFYKPLKLYMASDDDFYDTMLTLEKIGASGASISMPYKKLTDVYMMQHDSQIGNGNTIVFNDSIECYNTDWIGVYSNFLRFANIDGQIQNKHAHIYGNGAMAASIAYALTNLNSNINIKYFHRGEENLLGQENCDILINASPVGMLHIMDNVFTKERIEPYKLIADVVVRRDTDLIKTAKSLDKQYINGVDICFEQLCEQFKIYTNIEAPRAVLKQELKKRGFE